MIAQKCTSAIPRAQRAQAALALPGIRPVGQADWITVSQAYAAQIAEKAQLIATRREDVYRMLPEAEDAASELRCRVLDLLETRDDFTVSGDAVRCPDGRTVKLAGDPLLTLGQILQEDLCLHVKVGETHRLMGALLCFPASWTLAEKIGKPLMAIHTPVPEYDVALGKRVQRLFDGVQVGQPLWRANCLTYDDPALFQPKREADPRHDPTPQARYERSERQTLVRLPDTGAVLFAIHTTVAPRAI